MQGVPWLTKRRALTSHASGCHILEFDREIGAADQARLEYRGTDKGDRGVHAVSAVSRDNSPPRCKLCVEADAFGIRGCGFWRGGRSGAHQCSTPSLLAPGHPRWCPKGTANATRASCNSFRLKLWGLLPAPIKHLALLISSRDLTSLVKDGHRSS